MIDIFGYALCFCVFLSTGETRSKHKKYRILQPRSGDSTFFCLTAHAAPFSKAANFMSALVHICGWPKVRLYSNRWFWAQISEVQVEIVWSFKSMFCWSWNSWTPGWTKDTKSIGLKVFQTATTNTATWTGQGQVVCMHFLGYRECLLQRRRRFARFPVGRKGRRFRNSITRISAATWRPQTRLAN